MVPIALATRLSISRAPPASDTFGRIGRWLRRLNRA